MPSLTDVYSLCTQRLMQMFTVLQNCDDESKDSEEAYSEEYQEKCSNKSGEAK